MSSPTVPYFSFAEVARKVWWYAVVRGLLAVLLGVVVMANPSNTVIVIVRLVGAFLIIDGVVELIDGVRNRQVSHTASRVSMVAGAIGAAFGILLLVWPEATIGVLTVIVGAWAVIGGVLAAISGYGLRSIPDSGWGWNLFWGLVTVAFGLVLLLAPLSGLAAIAWVVGLYAVISGLVLVVAGFVLRSAGKRAAAAGM